MYEYRIVVLVSFSSRRSFPDRHSRADTGKCCCCLCSMGIPSEAIENSFEAVNLASLAHESRRKTREKCSVKGMMKLRVRDSFKALLVPSTKICSTAFNVQITGKSVTKRRVYLSLYHALPLLGVAGEFSAQLQ